MNAPPSEPAPSARPSTAASDKTCVHAGLLVLRLGIGGLFMVHGIMKLAAGPDTWSGVGGAMQVFGIASGAQAWGLAAALVETLGGLGLVLGLFVRPCAALLTIVMIVALAMHLNAGDGFGTWSHPAETGTACLALLIAGAGRMSLAAKIPALARRCWG